MPDLVTDLNGGFFDVVDCGTGERYHAALDDLPDLLSRLGVEPRDWEEARRPLTPHESSMLVTILVGLWRGLDRDLSRREAERWIAKHLTPSTKPNRLGLDYWRSCVEHDTHRYVPATVMAAALEANGIKFDGDKVFVKETENALPCPSAKPPQHIG
jgi:hypothetical protein